MGFKREQGFFHYSEKGGHQLRGQFNRAMLRLGRDGNTVSKGELQVTQRQSMMRNPQNGKRAMGRVK